VAVIFCALLTDQIVDGHHGLDCVVNVLNFPFSQLPFSLVLVLVL